MWGAPDPNKPIRITESTGYVPSGLVQRDYAVSHRRPWGWQVSVYLWTKSIAAGAFLVGAILYLLGGTANDHSLLTIGAHAGLEEEAREGRRQGDEALAQRIEHEGLEAFVNYWTALPMFAGLERRGPSFVAQVRAERMGNTVAGLAASLRGMGAGAMQPLWDDLPRVRVPSTFVPGQLDHGYVASARRLAAVVPNGRIDIVLRAGHTGHQEAVARISCRRFCSSVADSPAYLADLGPGPPPSASTSIPESSARAGSPRAAATARAFRRAFSR